MKIKIDKRNILNVTSYIAFLLVYLITLLLYGMGNAISRYRYFFFAIAIVIGFITIFVRLIKNNYTKIYGKKLFLIAIVGMVFLVFSFIKAKEVAHSIDLRTLVQIGLVVMPAMYAFCFINIFSTKNIINLMKITLIIIIIIYLCEPNHNILSFFNVSNWVNINFMTSTSFTESSMCAEPFLQLFLFFYYFSKSEKNIEERKYLKIFTWVSFIFTIFSFKRLGMLFAIAIILMEKIVDFKGKISTKFVWVFALFFTIATVFYTRFMQGEIFTNVDVYKFSTGRDYILSLWEKKNYFSYGYGTSMLVIDRYLEMDLVQIFLELNTFAVFIFSFAFFKVANKHIYSILIMFYAFANMLTASSLPWSLGWIISFITISLISSGKAAEDGYEYEAKKHKFKRLFSEKEGKNIKKNLNSIT